MIKPGAMLLAMPQVKDGVFDQTVCLIIDADENGTLGVVLNRFSVHDLDRVLPGWGDPASFPARLYWGGPVAEDGAICLASPLVADEEPPGWQRIFDTVGLLHLDTPQEIVQGAYRGLRIFAGYAGWSAGQLQDELSRGLWCLATARYEDVFDAEPHTLWRRAFKQQGGSLALLSTWTDTPELN